MSLDALKKQASRLSAYLGAKHRLNLKHASALEALAAVHGARNWQTLAAGVRNDDGDDASYVESAGVAQLTLSWHSDGRPHLSLPRASWLRHAIAFGETANDWLQASLAEAQDAGMQVLVFAHKHAARAIAISGSGQSGQAQDAARLTAAGINALLSEQGVALASFGKTDNWPELLRQVVVQRNRAMPLVVCLPALDGLFDEDLDVLQGLFRQARSFNVTLRAPARSLHAIRSRSAGDALLTNVAHQVFLGASRDDARDLLMARLQEAPAVCVSADGCRF